MNDGGAAARSNATRRPRSRLASLLGLLAGVAGQVVVPLLTEVLVGPPPAERPVYVPASFFETADALDRYAADHGRVPPADVGLGALVPKYLPEVPQDPWTKRSYVYSPAPDGASADLLSYGRDGQPGGDGPDADLSLAALTMGPPAPAPPSGRGRTWVVNGSFLLTPVLAFAFAARRPFAAGALAGAAGFTALLLGGAAFSRLAPGGLQLFALVTAALCGLGGVGVLRGGRWGMRLALLAIVVAWLQLSALAA